MKDDVCERYTPVKGLTCVTAHVCVVAVLADCHLVDLHFKWTLFK